LFLASKSSYDTLTNKVTQKNFNQTDLSQVYIKETSGIDCEEKHKNFHSLFNNELEYGLELKEKMETKLSTDDKKKNNKEKIGGILRIMIEFPSGKSPIVLKSGTTSLYTTFLYIDENNISQIVTDKSALNIIKQIKMNSFSNIGLSKRRRKRSWFSETNQSRIQRFYMHFTITDIRILDIRIKTVKMPGSI